MTIGTLGWAQRGGVLTLRRSRPRIRAWRRDWLEIRGVDSGHQLAKTHANQHLARCGDHVHILLGGNHLRHLKSGLSRHLAVEKHDVGRVLKCGLNGAKAVLGDSDHPEFGPDLASKRIKVLACTGSSSRSLRWGVGGVHCGMLTLAQTPAGVCEVSVSAARGP